MHAFRGYIHLKTIPNASQQLVQEAGLYADRLSINIELPTDSALQDLAPEKDAVLIKRAMAGIRSDIQEAGDATLQRKLTKTFAPAGQSTQMIVGADASSDATVLQRSSTLYGSYKLKRVYYSAFSPIPDSSRFLPLIKPPLMREHRLYQADWLMRFYGFGVDEITDVAADGMLDLTIDPKLAWALAHRAQFPLSVQTAARELLLRVPGFGTKTVNRIVRARRVAALGYDDLRRMGALMSKAKPFVTTKDWSPGQLTDAQNLKQRYTIASAQLELQL